MGIATVLQNGVLKWFVPKPPVPDYLDPKAEISNERTLRLKGPLFALMVVEACRRLGCTLDQAIGVAAHFANESAWGGSYAGNNVGGWKMTRPYAASYRKSHDGACPPFYRARGNAKSKDPPWCEYRVWPSLWEFFSDWLAHYCPRPGIECPYPLYRHTGELFWRGGDWFPALLAAGYRGEKTKRKPEGSIREYHKLVQEITIAWAQAALSVPVDKKWGKQSRAACVRFQEAVGLLPATGDLTGPTLEALAARYKVPT